MARDFSQNPLWHRYRVPDAEIRQPDMPHPPDGLLEWLEQQFPPRCRLPDETERDHERYAGKVELVGMIRQKLSEKDNN